jgi:hypothetical protein
MGVRYGSETGATVRTRAVSPFTRWTRRRDALPRGHALDRAPELALEMLGKLVNRRFHRGAIDPRPDRSAREINLALRSRR